MTNTFYQAHDLERLSGKPEYEGEFRSPFQVDRDRVLHTPAFRSLQSKTQVFWSGEYDFYRTRLTHSLEVAQIGRSICHWLLHHESNASNDLQPDYFIDPDLVEAACLSHDLGHPPFGHAGESVLNHHMADYGGFEGNAQTLRLLAERIFTQSRKGMNPTRAFLDAILKYKSLHSQLTALTGQAPKNHFIYDPQEKWLDWTLSNHDFPPELPPGDARDSIKSIECQIMDWADDSAYSLNDLADSARAGFLSEGRIQEWATTQGHSTATDSPLGELITAIRADMVEPFVGRRIGNYIKATSLERDTNFLSSTSNRYQYRLQIDPALKAESKLFKDLSYAVVFQSPRLKQLEHKGTYILSRLWETLHRQYIEGEKFHGQNFNLLPEAAAQEITQTPDPAQKARLLCDYLAAHTDGSAVRLYQRLFLAGHGSIGDLMV